MKYFYIFIISAIICSSIFSQEFENDVQYTNSPIPSSAVDDAVTLIKEAEGFRSCVYNDTLGYPTIGYGHKLLPSEKGVLTCISKAKAESLLRNDMKRAESEVINWWGTSLHNMNSPRIAALIDMTYNMGSVRWPHFTAQMKAGEYAAAAKNIMSTSYARQVGARAQRDACIIKNGYMFTKSNLCTV